MIVHPGDTVTIEMKGRPTEVEMVVSVTTEEVVVGEEEMMKKVTEAGVGGKEEADARMKISKNQTQVCG